MKSVIIGIVIGLTVGIITSSLFSSASSNTEDFDLEKIRYINEIDSCLELKEEYQLIKKYDSVLEHSDLYLEALKDRADNMYLNPNVKCEL